MSVDTKTVAGRREVHYANYDELLADARTLAGSDSVQMVGNWTLSGIFQHLAAAYTGSIDGLPFSAPWPMKIIAKLFMKKKMLTKPLPSGFRIPDGKAKEMFVPKDSVETADALAALESAVERLRSEETRVIHPFFGKMSREEWDAFHLRHAELHMSFAVPQSETAAV